MPFVVTDSTFGLMVSRHDVEQAVINLLQTPPQGSVSPLIVYYLAEVERQEGLAARSIPLPPGPSSYRGGVDFNTLMSEWFPLLTVNCQPTGPPERSSAATYSQWFELKIAATVGDDDEDQARALADWYGIAVATLIGQNGALGTPLTTDGWTVTKTLLTGYPTTDLIDPEVRQVLRSVCTFRTNVDVVLSERPKARTLGSDPYTPPATPPEVSEVDVTVTAVPFTSPLP